MKKIIFILTLTLGSFTFAQSSDTLMNYDKAYADLINYEPKNEWLDSMNNSQNHFALSKLTIGTFLAYSGVRQFLTLSNSDNEWFDHKIEQLANALFFDGKRILFSVEGGYSGCPDKLVDTIQLNNIEIINLKLCYSCSYGFSHGRFVKVFNSKMYTLMKIPPPDGRTELFYGKYKGRNKNRFKVKLSLNKDRTFKLLLSEHGDSTVTKGFWRNNLDTLILKPCNIYTGKDMNFNYSNVEWVEFNNIAFLLKKGKLIELNGARKLKQISRS